MRLKHICLALGSVMVLTSASAQDRLYKKNGEMIQVKIKEIGTRTITYKKFDNQNGPDYVIGKNEVDKIKYENGSEDEINDRPERADRGRAARPERERSGPSMSRHLSDDDYGKNIIALAPVVMTNTSPTGFGFSYERVLDKRNIFSIYLPFAYSFQNNDNYDYSTNTNNGGKDHMFWAYPGIKVYPTGSNRVVSYAIGINLPIGSGVETYNESYYDQHTGQYININHDDNIFVMGGMLTNYLNIQPTESLYLGIELGLGIPYVNNSDRGSNFNTPYDDTPLVQFSFRAGFRF